MHKAKRLGRLHVVLRAERELWYDTLGTGARVYKLLGLSWYRHKQFRSKVWAVTLPFISLHITWLKFT